MSRFQQSQSLLTEMGLSTPLAIIGPVLIGGLLAGFFFAFENPAIIMNADANGSGNMFKCWERTSCYWCSGETPLKPPFTPDTDPTPNTVVYGAASSCYKNCTSNGAPPGGCQTQYGTMPCYTK